MTAVLNDPATDGRLAGASSVVLTTGCAGTREVRDDALRNSSAAVARVTTSNRCQNPHQPVRPRRELACRAPSAIARSLAQTTLGATIGALLAKVPKPQSVPAITRSGPTARA